MRPVLVVSERLVARFPTLLARLLVGFAEKSIPVVLVVPPQVSIEPFLCGNVTIIPHPLVDLPLAERLDRRRMLTALMKCAPTVLHCLCESKASIVRIWARYLDVPYVLNVNGLQQRFSALSVSVKRCWKIVCLSERIARNIRELAADKTDRVDVIGIGTFPNRNTCCFSHAQRVPSIVMAGDIDDASDYESVFDAIHDLVREGYEFSVVVMGEGRAESALRQILGRRGLHPVVTIVPEMHPWRSVLSAADIFVEPRPLMRFSSFLLEAMSVGAAVAACRGGVDDLIIDGETALVFDPQDSLSIRAVLQRLLDRRELARQLADQAQEYLRRHHSVSQMIEGYLRVYHEVHQWSAGMAELR